jgi:hypothetical protein
MVVASTGALALFIFRCDAPNGAEPSLARDYLVFGRYAGECFGERCIEIFKIEQNAIYEDTLDLYPVNLYEGSFVKLNESKYEAVRHILDHVPPELRRLPVGRIGEPDSHDQGGIYVEIKFNNVRGHWLIDTQKSRLPAFLHAFVDTIHNVVERLK